MARQEEKLVIPESVGHVVIFKCTMGNNGCLIFSKPENFGRVELMKKPDLNSNLKSTGGEVLIHNMKIMKILLSYMICAILAIANSCGQTQNKAAEKQAKNTLLEYYSKHFYVWENTPISNTVPVNVLREKLDSLMQKYCTSKARSEAIQAFENVGADWLTKDLVGDLNENLKVKKDSTKGSEYIVSFTATYLDIPTKPVRENVVLHVTVVKEGESYKIDSVK